MKYVRATTQFVAVGADEVGPRRMEGRNSRNAN